MDIFLKISTVSLITVILGLVLSKNSKETTLLVSVTACVMITWAGLSYLKPVLSFFDTLIDMTQINSEMFQILLKATGVGLLGELTAMVCSDAGNATLGKTVQLTASMVIIWLSLPLFQGLLELIEGVMEGI